MLADDERSGERLVRLARRDERENLDLAPRESARCCGSERGRVSIQPREVIYRPEAFEDPARRVELHGGGLLVAQGATCRADQYTHSGRFIRHLELLPGH